MQKKIYSLTTLAIKAPPGMDTVPFLSIFGAEGMIGHTSRKYTMGKAHAAEVATNNLPMVTQLNLSAFMLQSVYSNTLKAVESANGNDVFMTFNDLNGKNTACRSYMEHGTIRLSFQKMPADSHVSLFIPAAVLAVANNIPCHDAYQQFINKMSASTVYRFCDEFYYDFLLNCNKEAMVADDLSMEMISQAMDSGYYEAFRNLKAPDVTKPAKKKPQKKETVEKNKARYSELPRRGTSGAA